MTTKIKRQARRSRDEWRQLVAEQQRSALSEAVFCERQGISLERFHNWRRRLAKSARPDDWLELDPVRAPPAQVWDIELELGQGICLRLRRS